MQTSSCIAQTKTTPKVRQTSVCPTHHGKRRAESARPTPKQWVSTYQCYDIRADLHNLAAEETKQENANSLLLPEEKVASPQAMTDVVQNQTPETLLDPNLSPEVKNAAVNIMNELDAVKPTPQPDTTQLFINGVNGNVDRIIDSRGKPKPQLETATPDADTAQLIDLFKSGLDGKRQTPVPTTPTDNVTQAFFDGLNGIRRYTDTTTPTTAEDAKAIVENDETDAAEAASDFNKRVDVDEDGEKGYTENSFDTHEQQHSTISTKEDIRTRLSVNSKQFGKKVGKHAQDYGLDPASPLDREKILTEIFNIIEHFDECRVGFWRGQENEVVFYIKGEDVVITKSNGEFVTIMKGGITNERVKNARKRKI